MKPLVLWEPVFAQEGWNSERCNSYLNDKARAVALLFSATEFLKLDNV